MSDKKLKEEFDKKWKKKIKKISKGNKKAWKNAIKPIKDNMVNKVVKHRGRILPKCVKCKNPIDISRLGPKMYRTNCLCSKCHKELQNLNLFSKKYKYSIPKKELSKYE